MYIGRDKTRRSCDVNSFNFSLDAFIYLVCHHHIQQSHAAIKHCIRHVLSLHSTIGIDNVTITERVKQLFIAVVHGA